MPLWGGVCPPYAKEAAMQQSTLFGDLCSPITKKIVLKSIEARYSNIVVREDAPEWVNCRFTSPRQIYEMFQNLALEAKEHFITLHLDGKNRIACFDRVSVGSLNQTIVHPREIFKTALLSSAAAIVLIHNHPSGDPTPSREDLEITRRIKEAGELLGIRVLDHIIVGNGQFLSMTEGGLL